MQVFHNKSKIIITCSKRLSPYLQQEVTELGFNTIRNFSTGAEHAIVKGDELHLSNVIFNLMDNAIKYSKDEPEINISTQNSGKNLVIRVRDNGIGMNRDQLSKIFDQFYRIPTGNLHDVKGFGLGLSYVSNIVKLLQGTIHVKSERNRGSEFEIIFRTA